MVVLQFIRKALPDAEIHWFCEEVFRPLLANHPQVARVVPVRLKKLKKEKSLSGLFREITRLRNQGPYDLVIDLQGLMKSALVARLIGGNKSVGFDKNSLRERPAAWLYGKSYAVPYDANVIHRNFLLAAYALELEPDLKQLETKEPFLYPKEKSFSAEGVVLFMVGASWPSKVWPATGFAALAGMLGKRVVLVWGNEEEKKRAEEIHALAPKTEVAPKLSLDALATLVKESDLVVGGDTGPTHMAWALNRPSVTIFGPTPWWRNTLTTEINKTVHADTRVDPLKLDREDMAIETVTAEEVAAVALPLLN